MPSKVGVILLLLSLIVVLWDGYLWGFKTTYDLTVDTIDPAGVGGLAGAGVVLALTGIWRWRTGRSGGPLVTLAFVLAALAVEWVVTRGSNSSWAVLDLGEAVALGGAGWGLLRQRAGVTTYFGGAAIALLLSDMWLNILQGGNSGTMSIFILGVGAEAIAAGLCAYAVRSAKTAA